MFAIRLLSPTQVSHDGEQLAEIVAGDFRETFACHSDDFTGLEQHWREQLRALVEGEPVVILRHDPRFAWVAYGEGAECYIQQRLSLDGSFVNLLPRVTTNEEGEQVSEWTTNMAAIRQFLDAESTSLSACST
ncbi:MAG: hypothetical protein C0467_19270 [Planctomycetaceae bacterium]|nr:hypothetical protein [Planctomycetaceae bacterium]